MSRGGFSGGRSFGGSSPGSFGGSSGARAFGSANTRSFGGFRFAGQLQRAQHGDLFLPDILGAGADFSSGSGGPRSLGLPDTSGVQRFLRSTPGTSDHRSSAPDGARRPAPGATSTRATQGKDCRARRYSPGTLPPGHRPPHQGDHARPGDHDHHGDDFYHYYPFYPFYFGFGYPFDRTYGYYDYPYYDVYPYAAYYTDPDVAPYRAVGAVEPAPGPAAGASLGRQLYGEA